MDNTCKLDFDSKSFINAIDDGTRSTMTEGFDARRNISFCNVDSSVFAFPAPPSKMPHLPEMLTVYLRIKPNTKLVKNSVDISDESDNSIISIESDTQVFLFAPNDCRLSKSSHINGNTAKQRFTFSKVFGSNSDQSHIFKELALPRLRDFLMGQNQLIFSYGATSSGKTYTIQGLPMAPGIIPRSIDVIFNTLGDKQFDEMLNWKPFCFNQVVIMNEKELIEAKQEKIGIFQMGYDLAGSVCSSSNGICSSIESDLSGNSVYSDLSNRIKEEAKIELKKDSLKYAVWISFAEIYNENVYDLLERIPTNKKPSELPRRRIPLKLVNARQGSVYIKGLKEVRVMNADETIRLLTIGRNNLKFASTKLNHNSSRSHCIFTIKIIRAVADAQARFASVSILSFCDLAGHECIDNLSSNKGERKMETGRINASLLVLGKVIRALRYNQTVTKEKHQIVPFRESNLTRLFHSFLVSVGSLGRTSMIVNINQSASMYDKSLQVMKFSAIASKVITAQVKDDTKKSDRQKRCTRFSTIIMNQNASYLNRHSTIIWENPSVRSTICPNAPQRQSALSPPPLLNNSAASRNYDALLKLIDTLKDQVKEEKEKNSKLESKVRVELCERFNEMIVNIENSNQQRLQDEMDRAEEFNEARIKRLEMFYEDQIVNARKRARLDEDEDEIEDYFSKLHILEDRLRNKTEDVEQLTRQISAMKESHQSNLQNEICLQQEITKIKFELESQRIRYNKVCQELEATDAKEKMLLKTTKTDEENMDVHQLKAQIDRMKAQLEQSEEKCSDFKVLLDEASQEYIDKNEELALLNTKLDQAMTELCKQKDAASEATRDADEYHDLYADAIKRIDENDNLVNELESQLDQMKAVNHEILEQLEHQQIKTGTALPKLEETVDFENNEAKFINEESELHDLKISMSMIMEELNELKQKDATSKDELTDKISYISELESVIIDKECKLVAIEDNKVELFNQLRTLQENLEQKIKEVEKLTESTMEHENVVVTKDERLAVLQDELRILRDDQVRTKQDYKDDVERLQQLNQKCRQELSLMKKENASHKCETMKMENEIKHLLRLECEHKDSSLKLESDIREKDAFIESLQQSVTRKDNTIKGLDVQIAAFEKEQNALKILEQELERKYAENSKLSSRIEQLEADIEARKFDVENLNEEKRNLMNHYEQVITKNVKEIAREKHEVMTLRNVLSNCTPNKQKQNSSTIKRTSSTESDPINLNKKTPRRIVKKELRESEDLMSSIDETRSTRSRTAKKSSITEEDPRLVILKSSVTPAPRKRRALYNENSEVEVFSPVHDAALTSKTSPRETVKRSLRSRQPRL